MTLLVVTTAGLHFYTWTKILRIELQRNIRKIIAIIQISPKDGFRIDENSELFYWNHYWSLISVFRQGSTACLSPSRCSIALVHLTKSLIQQTICLSFVCLKQPLLFLFPYPTNLTGLSKIEDRRDTNLLTHNHYKLQT